MYEYTVHCICFNGGWLGICGMQLMFGTVWVGGWAVLINLLYCFYLFSRLKLWHELRSGTVHFKGAVSRDFRPLFFMN